MRKEKGMLGGTPPKCDFSDGVCEAYITHFNASTDRGKAHYNNKQAELAEQRGEYEKAEEFRTLASGDRVAAQIMEDQVEKLRKNKKLCSICPYR